MNTKIAEIRLTLYSLISALETDLRDVVRTVLVPSSNDLSFIKELEVREKIIKRYEKDNPGLSACANLDTLIEFLDFQESYKIILQNKEIIPSPIIAEIKSVVPDLDKTAEIRNRVMHSRPLLAGDFTHVFALVSKLIPEKRIEWSACQRTIQKLDDDPSFVFSLKIPHEPEDLHAFHNLPMPDFDESGFVGRETDCEQVKNLLLGNSRVVSVIGDGGVGKSALILKVAYDIVDMGGKCPFDAIVWSSAKAAMLTTSGVESIRNALRDFSGVLENIAGKLSGRVRDYSR